MNEMPEQVEVAALVYDVRVIDMSRIGDGNLWGQARLGQLVMEIETTLPPLRKKDSLFHEVMHTIWHSYAPYGEFSSSDEEYIVNAMAHGVFQVLRRNPKLVAYLLSDEPKPGSITPGRTIHNVGG